MKEFLPVQYREFLKKEGRFVELQELIEGSNSEKYTQFILNVIEPKVQKLRNENKLIVETEINENKGYKYKGEAYEDKQHGLGKRTNPWMEYDNKTWTGTFVEGKLNGFGKYEYYCDKSWY